MTSLNKVNSVLCVELDYSKLGCCIENSGDPDQLASEYLHCAPFNGFENRADPDQAALVRAA